MKSGVFLTIREQLEENETKIFSQYACLSKNTIGREKDEEKCPLRTEFQRDRDRILHCNAFRRLMHKTQVFLSPQSEHYRTRLTHTLEVAQIGRTMARALGLNEDLVEAACLGHDLGHTPFGHAGEFALREICPYGYVHAEQSVRVVKYIERDGNGLNLTEEVIDAIACHSSGKEASTLEGKLVRFADKIAYMNHDIEDSIRAGILSDNDIPWNIKYTVGKTKSERITAFITSVVENSTDDIKMADDIQKCFTELKTFLFDEVYNNSLAKNQEGKARELVKTLYKYYFENIDKLPDNYKIIADKWDNSRAVCDYISGMTDKYAIDLYESLFIPKAWVI